MQLLQGLFFIWGSELVLILFLLLAYLTVRLTPWFPATCFLAVVSVSCVVLNPYVVHRLLAVLKLHTVWRVYFPHQYVVLLIAVVSGHVALRRIRQSSTPLRGRNLAWTGLVLGYAWLGCGLGYLLLYTIAWSSVW
jgi:hypothetical protein